MDDKEVRFINRLYKDLYKSKEAMHTANPKDPSDKIIEKYFRRLEKAHDLATNAHKKELLKELYYKKYVIKEKDIHVIPNGETKESIINKQKKTLSKWLDYFFDVHSNYPMWAKYWALQGMLRIGQKKPETRTYQKRSKKTIADYIDLEPAVLDKCIQNMIHFVKNKNTKETNEILRKYIEGGSFAKMYTTLYEEEQKRKRVLSDKNDGIWIKYDREKTINEISDEPQKLYESLQKNYTGWCTAGSYETAYDQIVGYLEIDNESEIEEWDEEYYGGDFYVYYTKDEENKYTVPRIAIRMNRNEIGEIRGIDEGQNLEEGLEDILEDKLNEIGIKNKEKTLKKLESSRTITNLKYKMRQNILPTPIEFKSIYDSNSDYFGWDEINDDVEEYVDKHCLNIDFYNSMSTDDERAIFIRRNIQKKFQIKINLNKEELIDKLLKDEFIINDEYFYKYLYSNLSDELLHNEILNLEIIKTNRIAYKYIDKELRKKDSFNIKCFENDEEIIFLEEFNYKSIFNEKRELFSEEKLRNIVKKVYSDPSRAKRAYDLFSILCPTLLDDKDFILKIVLDNNELVNFIKEEWYNDKDVREFIEKICITNPSIMYRITSLNNNNILSNDYDFMLKLLKETKNISIYDAAGIKLQSDREFVLEVAKNVPNLSWYNLTGLASKNGMVMKYHDKPLEKPIIKIKISNAFLDVDFLGNDEYVEDFIADETEKDTNWRDCKEYIDTSIRENVLAIDEITDKDIKTDKKRNNSLEYHKAKKIQKECNINCLKENIDYLKYFDEKFFDNEENLLAIVKINYNAMKYIPHKYKDKEEFLEKVLKINYRTIEYFPQSYYYDKEKIKKVLKINPNVIRKLPKENIDKELAIVAVRKSPFFYLFLKEDLMKNEEIIGITTRVLNKNESLYKNKDYIKPLFLKILSYNEKYIKLFNLEKISELNITMIDILEANPNTFKYYPALRKNKNRFRQIILNNPRIKITNEIVNYFNDDQEIIDRKSR